MIIWAYVIKMLNRIEMSGEWRQTSGRAKEGEYEWEQKHKNMKILNKSNHSRASTVILNTDWFKSHVLSIHTYWNLFFSFMFNLFSNAKKKYSINLLEVWKTQKSASNSMVISMQLSAIESVEKNASGNVCKANASTAVFHGKFHPFPSFASSSSSAVVVFLLFAFHALHIVHLQTMYGVAMFNWAFNISNVS